jgi:hypothetical protein
MKRMIPILAVVLFLGAANAHAAWTRVEGGYVPCPFDPTLVNCHLVKFYSTDLYLPTSCGQISPDAFTYNSNAGPSSWVIKSAHEIWGYAGRDAAGNTGKVVLGDQSVTKICNKDGSFYYQYGNLLYWTVGYPY